MQPPGHLPIGDKFAVVLLPGLNRILVQSLDAALHETERSTIDVWYDEGSPVSVGGTLATSTVWTAAAGPYPL